MSPLPRGSHALKGLAMGCIPGWDSREPAFFLFSSFFFWGGGIPHPWHVTIPGRGIKPMPQQWEHWIFKHWATRELQDPAFFTLSPLLKSWPHSQHDLKAFISQMVSQWLWSTGCDNGIHFKEKTGLLISGCYPLAAKPCHPLSLSPPSFSTSTTKIWVYLPWTLSEPFQK